VFTPEQYRAKAAEYTELAKQGNTPDEVREFHTHEQSLTMLANNKQWLANNDDKLADNSDEIVNVPKPSVWRAKRLWQRKRSISCDAVEHVADRIAKGTLR